MEETPDSLPDLSDDVTELPNAADQEMHRKTKPQAELKYLQSVTNERKINNWLKMKVANFGQTPATETELEKMRQDMELAMLKYQYEEKQKQRQHKEKMELMRLQASGPAAEGLQDLLKPQTQLSLFLYFFIFIHVIYIKSTEKNSPLCTSMGPAGHFRLSVICVIPVQRLCGVDWKLGQMSLSCYHPRRDNNMDGTDRST
ncbi:hypothetical protein Y1Q_0011071 [Alligator mississippiensis]|uniref:Uncharacterized protein n=1 Tax=Alligator mississippiensis TaxID=8496 RepID=A0A151NWE9_ALLMI|nr:hypothetical protein Y1Q_0011071 [Alligator mississippiensis]